VNDQQLCEAAEEAARLFLDTLPAKEDCAHTFSPEFEAEMDALLHPRRKRRIGRWKQVLVLAAVLCALAAGVTAGAQRKPSYQMYWSQKDGILSYSIRVNPDSFTSFHPMKPGYVPEGFVPSFEDQRVTSKTTRYAFGYSGGKGRGFEVYQLVQDCVSGTREGNYEAKEVLIGDKSALLYRSPYNPDNLTLLWVDGPNILQLKGWGLPEEEVIQIAENLHN